MRSLKGISKFLLLKDFLNQITYSSLIILKPNKVLTAYQFSLFRSFLRSQGVLIKRVKAEFLKFTFLTLFKYVSNHNDHSFDFGNCYIVFCPSSSHFLKSHFIISQYELFFSPIVFKFNDLLLAQPSLNFLLNFFHGHKSFNIHFFIVNIFLSVLLRKLLLLNYLFYKDYKNYFISSNVNNKAVIKTE